MASISSLSNSNDNALSLKEAAENFLVNEKSRGMIKGHFQFYFNREPSDTIIDAIYNQLRTIVYSGNLKKIKELSQPKTTPYSRDNLEDQVHLIFSNVIAGGISSNDPEALPAANPETPSIALWANSSPIPKLRESIPETDFKAPPDRGASKYVEEFAALIREKESQNKVLFDELRREIESSSNEVDFLRKEEAHIPDNLVEQSFTIPWLKDQRKEAQRIYTCLMHSFDPESRDDIALQKELKKAIIFCECLFPVTYEPGRSSPDSFVVVEEPTPLSARELVELLQLILKKKALSPSWSSSDLAEARKILNDLIQAASRIDDPVELSTLFQEIESFNESLKLDNLTLPT